MRRTTRTRRRRGLGALFATVAAGIVFTMLPASGGAIVAGAGFTTTKPGNESDCLSGPGVVNCNIYKQKQDVWINGGPTQVGPSALTDGSYFFAVLSPGGQPDPNDGGAKNLSDDFDTYANRTFTVAGGDISAYGGTHLKCDSNVTGTPPSGACSNSVKRDQGLLIRLFPYADTTNPGGVYILAICSLANGVPVSPSDCKYDAFKVRRGQPPPPFGTVSGMKYYDANGNGMLDAGEEGIEDWPIDISDGTLTTILTGAGGTFGPLSLVSGTYAIAEQQSAVAGWVQTGNTVNQFLDTGGNSTSLSSFVYTVGVVDGGSTSGLNFGNVCTQPSGGRTPGFWQGPVGQALITADDLQDLRDLHLVWPDGTDFDPAAASELIAFNQESSAQNMASQLSRHLGALQLNLNHGFVQPGDVILGSGGMTAAQILAAADALLAQAGGNSTVEAGELRDAQEAMKNLIASINQNESVVVVGNLEDALELCGDPFSTSG